MKKTVLSALALLLFGIASAQTDPQQAKTESKSNATVDTTSTLNKVTPESIKQSDAVQTKDHKKVTKKDKTEKDSIASQRRRNP